MFGHFVADRALEGAHVRPVQRLNVSREVPLDVAQFDVRPGVAHDAAKFCSNVLWRTIQNQEPSFSNQPNQLQIQFVIDQGDLMTCKVKEKRPVLKRSMLIILTKNSVLQIEQGDLLKQSKSLNVAQTHDRTGRPVTDTAAVQDDSQVRHEETRSTLMKKYFVKEWRNPLLFMTRVMNR